ncbi:cleavage and polyadenylation specificity factor subunit 4 [Entomortierella parvispora]|uniref:Cleavage and polyadenylation specificity factor subunit 4 n=1 Tax=Entomortierella parvispora TaxID=205924 RepID=A0A9P3H1R6_9FUNG|nr:cleavage and polyadenylation specificity factor subunit 4 [Entomortierella parvispora]
MSDQELLAQIAQVAGAINKHINTPAVRGFQGYHGYNQNTRGGYPVQSRGRGRGAHAPAGAFNRSLTLNNTSAAPRPPYARPMPATTTPAAAVTPVRPTTSTPYFPTTSSAGPQSTPRPLTPSRHLTLVNTNKNTTAPPNGPASQSSVSGNSVPVSPISPASVPVTTVAPTQQWIQSKRKNMSLMNESTFKKTMVAKQKSIQASKESRLKLLKAKRANQLGKGIVTVGGAEYTKSRDGRKLVMHNNKPVVINGVEFEMDRRGNKLVRKAVAGAISKLEAPTIKAGLGPTTPSAATTTPKQFSMGGVYYVRTRNGNLVRATLVKDQLLRARQEKGNKRQRKARPFCRNFTRFGRCHRDYLCPLVHSRDHLAICKKFLRGICPHSASTCLLSHVPNPHTTPPCQHFQRAACTKDNCPYPHIKKNPQAPICRPFATEGWCNDGDACKDRHVWICPDFGTPAGCKRKCGLAHLENGGLKVKKTAEEMEKSRQEWQKAMAAGEVVGGKRKFGTQQQQQQQQQQQPGSRYWEKPSDAGDGSVADQFDENFIPLSFDEASAEEDDIIMDEDDILEEDADEAEDISSDGVATDDDEGEDDESENDEPVEHDEEEDTRVKLRAIERVEYDSDEDQDVDPAQQELDDYYAAQDLEEYM